jgi:L-ascorbate metabolism protein UlaG (beta-lactamase superfamily)
MPKVTIKDVKRAAIRTVATIAVIAIVAGALLAWAWHTRPQIADTGLHAPVDDVSETSGVTVTWLGVTTLLFDDGETQILIDGFISRPSLFETLLGIPIASDAPMINYVLNEYRVQRLAAIIPAHSHYDHAMDIGAIANRSSASIIGSETTANIARGAGVPEDQIIVVTDATPYTFGNFTVTLIPSVHAPIGSRGTVPFPGTVDEPLQAPAPISAWRVGTAYSIVIAHPQGKTVVHGSAGYVEGALDEIGADVIMLSVGLLESLGRDYAEDYWQALVTATGATRVFPVHFDDFTQPFGDIVLMPALLDDFVNTATWLQEFRDTWDKDTQLFLPVFGQPLPLYPEERPDA